MTKKISRIIAILMLIFSIAFVAYALNHPEASFTWSNTSTYAMYALYVAIMVFLLIAPFKKK